LINQNSRCGVKTRNKVDGRIDKTAFSNKRVKSNLYDAAGPKLASASSIASTDEFMIE
jgi:hypothetical protein